LLLCLLLCLVALPCCIAASLPPGDHRVGAAFLDEPHDAGCPGYRTCTAPADQTKVFTVLCVAI
jgi:hypothetical protein